MLFSRRIYARYHKHNRLTPHRATHRTNTARYGWQTAHYTRTAQQDLSLGLQPSKEALAAGTVNADSRAKPAPRSMEGSAALLAMAGVAGGKGKVKEVEMPAVYVCVYWWGVESGRWWRAGVQIKSTICCISKHGMDVPVWWVAVASASHFHLPPRFLPSLILATVCGFAATLCSSFALVCAHETRKIAPSFSSHCVTLAHANLAYQSLTKTPGCRKSTTPLC